jgi:hypothetical protein
MHFEYPSMGVLIRISIILVTNFMVAVRDPSFLSFHFEGKRRGLGSLLEAAIAFSISAIQCINFHMPPDLARPP